MKEKLVSARMNALWFTYIALFQFSLLPNMGIYLSFLQIIAISTVLTVLLNLWNAYRDDKLLDERNKRVATNGMAWGFVVVSIALIATVSTETELTEEMIRINASLGFWIWLNYFSVSNLYHKYGGDFL